MNRFEKHLALPQELSSVTRARHFVRDALLGWDLEALVEDAELGTTELVANGIRHAGTDLTLTISVESAVTISIRDGRPELRRPVVPEYDQLAESGRGLHIVAAIAQDWGITAAAEGKVVWFTLALPVTTGTDADVLSMTRRRAERPAPREFHSDLHGVEHSLEARRRGGPASVA